jgi:pSer/pThr/pTyr-binding forkhead associated (FHA) protein
LTGTVDVPVQKPEILIGRAPDNHIVIHHSEVSSSHLRLYVHRDRIQVVDLESRNGSSLSLGGVQSEMIARHLYDWPVGAEVAIPRQSPAVVALVLAPKERK